MIMIIVNNVESKLSECPTDFIVEEIRKELRYKNDADNPYVRQKFQRFNYEILETSIYNFLKEEPETRGFNGGNCI